MRKLVFATLCAIALLLVPASAQANSVGQCSGPSGKSVNSVNAFYKNLQTEGVVSQAAKVFESAGYRQRDGKVSTWLKNDAVVLKLAASATIQNYGCRNGKLFGAGKKTLRKGAKVVVSLPEKYGKGDFASRKTKKFSQKRVVTARFVGQTTCSNPGKGTVKVVIWVLKKQKPSKKPEQTPSDTPTTPTTPPPPEQPKIPAPIAETPGLAHTYVKGNADLFLKVKPAPGRDVAVQANVTAGGGTVSGVQSSSTYADEACPAEWKCYRAKFWAPNSPGKSRVTFTVNQDDGQTTEVVTEISIVPDEF